MSVVMDVFRGDHGDSGVTVFGVVPGKEVATERPGIFDRAEAYRISGTILEGFERRFGKRVVVGYMWAGMGLGHPQIGQELREGSRFH